MDHYVVIEYEKMAVPLRAAIFAVAGQQLKGVATACYNVLYTVPITMTEWEFEVIEDPACFAACRVWLENNRVEGSKYAITKMWLV